MNRLEVIRGERPAERSNHGSTTRTQGQWYKTGRVFADFVVDGVVLSGVVRKMADLISVLGWGAKNVQDDAVNRLLLSLPSEFPDNRYALFVCPECGDMSCGAVTAVIERDGDSVVWRDWGFQNNYDGNPSTRDHLESLGEYHFLWADYQKAIRGAYGMGGFDQAGNVP